MRTWLWLLWLSLAQALDLANFPGSISQCQPLSINWSLDQSEPRSPFNITFYAFFSAPINLTVTPSDSEDAGIFTTTLPFPTGYTFLVMAPNSSISPLISVTPSSNSSCIAGPDPKSQPPPVSPYFIKSKPDNCIPKLFNMTCIAKNCTDAPVIRGFVPNGQAPFPVATIATGVRTSWFISAKTETQIMLEMTNNGTGIGTSQLFVIGGPEAIEDCVQFITFNTKDLSNQQSLPAKTPPSGSLASRTIIGIVVAGSVGLIGLLWLIFFIRRYLKRNKKTRNRGIEGGTQGSQTMTDRDFVLDSEFGMTFSSMMASSRGTMTVNSKAFESQLEKYRSSNIPLPLDRGGQQLQGKPIRSPPTKPPPIKVPSYVPMDVVAEVRNSEEPLINQGNLSPSLLPEWARRLSQRSTATTIKRQTKESGRIV